MGQSIIQALMGIIRLLRAGRNWMQVSGRAGGAGRRGEEHINRPHATSGSDTTRNQGPP